MTTAETALCMALGATTGIVLLLAAMRTLGGGKPRLWRSEGLQR